MQKKIDKITKKIQWLKFDLVLLRLPVGETATTEGDLEDYHRIRRSLDRLVGIAFQVKIKINVITVKRIY